MRQAGFLKGGPGRVLVTGGAGFIGSHVAETLCKLGWQVEVLDDLSAGKAGNLPVGVTLRVGDIRSEADVSAALKGGPLDAIVHCAAQTSVERSMKEPAVDGEVNVIGTHRLVHAAKAAGVPRFVFLSSGGAIYGETAEPADEATMPAPRSYYGLHKYVAEELVRSEGLPFAILRPSNVYGPRQRADAEGGVVAIFSERLRAGKPLDIHGDGRQVRDFIHVSDVAAAVVVALQAEDDVIWNVASGEAIPVIDLAKAMADALARPLDMRFRPQRAGDVHKSLISPRALLATELWGPPLTLAQGLRLVLAEGVADSRIEPGPGPTAGDTPIRTARRAD